jgi:hypothetical protein
LLLFDAATRQFVPKSGSVTRSCRRQILRY